MLEATVRVSAWKACADQLGVTGALEGLVIEVRYWGEPLTLILKTHASASRASFHPRAPPLDR